MSKLSKKQFNKCERIRLSNKSLSVTPAKEEHAQLILSPFVHLFNINEETKCLYNSLTMKKVYLTNEKYAKILTHLCIGDSSDDLKKLIDLRFVVPQGFDKEKVFDTIANNVLRKKPLPSLSYVLVTDFCNFRCGYCFIENSLNGPSISMSKDVADKLVNVLINAAKEVS